MTDTNNTETMSSNKFERFEAWMKENGACCDYIELREYGDTAEEQKAPGAKDDQVGRGVHARQAIPANTKCIVVPKKCLITSEMGKATPVGQLVEKSGITMHATSHNYIILFVLWDRQVNGENSFFQPYYDILPTDFSNMPTCWTEQELNMLEGSDMREQIDARNQRMRQDYEAISNISPDFGTYEDFEWVRMCITSRCFGMTTRGQFMTALVPQADMLNHQRPRKLKYSYNDAQDALQFTS